MLVKHMRVQILKVLIRKSPSVKSLYLVAHDVPVLLDVVLLVELIPKRDDILPRDICIGVEFGAGGGIGRSDIVLYEIALLAEIDVRIELVNVRVGHTLVDGHKRLLHLTADFRAGNPFVYIKIIDD